MNQTFRCFLSLITALLLLFSLSSCTAKGTLESAFEQDSPTAGTSTTESASNAPVSLERFKSEIQEEGLGTVNEIKGDYGYDAALVTSSDQTNYIYMYLPYKESARSILTDLDGDGVQDSDLTLILQKDNYELYTQESTETGSTDSGMYGKCLWAGSMIIMISGPIENKEQISASADDFLIRLGFAVS